MGFKDGLKKIVLGGPQHQERKRLEKEAKAEAFKSEMEGYKIGLMAGAKQRGINKGHAKMSQKSGLSGFGERMGAGMEAFSKGAGAMTAGMNFEGMGKGLNSDFTGIGGFGGGQSNRRQKTRVIHHHHYHNKKRR